MPLRSGYDQAVLISEFGCQSEKSDSFFVDVSSTHNLNPNLNFVIFPNPGNGKFHLKTTDGWPCTVEIYDASGKWILTKEHAAEITLDKKGVYWFNVHTPKGSGVKKVIAF